MAQVREEVEGVDFALVAYREENVWRMAEVPEDRLHDLRAAASDVRLQSYRESDQGDVDTVVHYLWNLRLSLVQPIGRWTFREFLRVDNLADRRYVGSVIVNEGNRRFFEPAPGRALHAGLRIAL